MINRIFLLLPIMLLVLASCTKNVEEPGAENEHDAINSVTLTFRQNGNVTGTFMAEDPDGDGGNPPTRIDTIRLQANQVYTAELTLKNISGSTVTDISNRIKLQGTSHELFYLVSGAAVVVLKTDLDVNNLPIGFNTTWTTTLQGSGNVLIKLMHKPFIKRANDPHTVGHTDLALTMPIVIR